MAEKGGRREASRSAQEKASDRRSGGQSEGAIERMSGASSEKSCGGERNYVAALRC